MSDIQKRFAELKNAVPRLRVSDAKTRAAKIKRLWEETLARREDLYAAGASERGSGDLDIAAELVMVKGEVDFAIKNVGKWMKPQKVKNSMSTMGKRCEIRYQSRGVTLNLPAFNAPTAESIVPNIAAIAAGNAVVLKPSELAPHSSKVLKEIYEAALPHDEAYVVEGGVEVAQELLALPFDHIYFTGGTAVGRIVMKAAAENFTAITLEMGGKCPVIVDATAKLENAATKIVWGRLLNTGAACIAPEYVLIEEAARDEFVDHLKTKIEELYNSEGTGFENSKYFGRIINRKHFDRINGLLQDALGKGAVLEFGGQTDAEQMFIAPTVLSGVDETMDIMHEEVFGPILTISTWTQREEVLASIEKRPNPLALYIYSTDEDSTEFFLNNTVSGSAVVNNNTVQSGTNPNLPFGGVGASGIGRICGFEGFKSMSNMRSVVHQPLDRFRDFLMQLPPYSDRYRKMIMGMLK